MGELEQIRKSFENRRYVRLKDVHKLSKNDIWYRHASSTDLVDHWLRLRYMPASKSYAVYVGASNRNARRTVLSFIPSFSRFIMPFWSNPEVLMGWPCWQMFNGARTMGWDHGSIPDPLQREAWVPAVDALVERFIQPSLLAIQEIDSLISLLLRPDRPFEWFMSDPVLRILEIAAMAKLAGTDSGVLKPSIKAQSKAMQPHVRNEDVENIVDAIFQAVCG
jgi:hypothetical protein